MTQPWTQPTFVTTKFTRKQHINFDALADEIRAALGDKYISMDMDDSSLIVRFIEDVTNADKDAVDALIQAHDHTVLSKEEKRKQAYTEANQRFKALDIDAIGSEKNSAKQTEDILAALRDIQTILRGEYDVV